VQFDHSSNTDIGPQRIKWVSWSSDQTSPRDIAVTKDGTVYITGLVTDAGNATFGTGAGASVLDFGQVEPSPTVSPPQFVTCLWSRKTEPEAHNLSLHALFVPNCLTR
jgi:hypothetical protein